MRALYLFQAEPRCMENVCKIFTTGRYEPVRQDYHNRETAGQTVRGGTEQHQVKRSYSNWGSRGREFKSPQPDHGVAGESRCGQHRLFLVSRQCMQEYAAVSYGAVRWRNIAAVEWVTVGAPNGTSAGATAYQGSHT